MGLTTSRNRKSHAAPDCRPSLCSGRSHLCSARCRSTMAQRPADWQSGFAGRADGCRREALLQSVRLGRDAEPLQLLILPPVSVPLLMRWLKGSKARSANRILGRTGQPFWQDESFDHYLRAANHLDRTVAYIEQNPVSAGFVCSAEHWPWSSAGWRAKGPAPPMQPRGKV